MDKQKFADVMNTKQVCAYWPFLNQNTMRYMRHAGTGPASFVINGKVFYRRAEVERWLAEQEAATTRGGVA
ncbi:helix-turn-helix transcriptional regulator [Gordonia humi]|uniref:Helix-turn-helix domain-containing protein n=1 Tax=Gordonia humi TaxID=686429 RepID=A0A840EWM2_9ACTN|nr:helix-turn-helix domain-containing protein [Gordonia humi]MBB4134728.1 hypothetical protein [Gordonia humi]